jgi:ATP-dependent DNA ligase
MVYIDDVNIVGESIHTRRKNLEALLVASLEIGLEVHAEKSKYTIMSHENNAK